ncbi:MAG TPA: DUF6272 family protein [Leptolyngbyaceae cyanobacterium]
MTQIFGDFIDNISSDRDSLELIFTHSSHSLKLGWRNNRLSAHFVANYFLTFLPVDDKDPNGEDKVRESRDAVSYVGNELLENAMKHNDIESNYQVKFGIHLLEESELKVVIFASNALKSEEISKFQDFIKELITSDPDELFVRQVEKSAEEEYSESSGLGLITSINDYSAKLGWKFEPLPSQPDFTIVTAMAQLKVL